VAAVLVGLAAIYFYVRPLGWWLLPIGVGIAAIVALVLWRVHLRRRIRAETLQEMLDLTPANFERAIGDLLRDRGYSHVKNVGRTGDQGIDLLCRDRNGRPCGVQCKRYSPGRSIGSPELRRFLGSLVFRDLEHGIYVTTSTFTNAALEVAGHSHIELIDGERLTSMLLDRQQRNAIPSAGAASTTSAR
jgi:restriction system protein